MSVVLTLDHARVLAWPKQSRAQGERHLPLALALTDEHATDAHAAAYYSGAVERRLSRDAIGKTFDGAPFVPILVVFFVDVDGPGHVRTPEWWAAERLKIDRLFEAHPGGFAYATRGGYRLVYLLERPCALERQDDAGAWSALYIARLAYLQRVFDINGDRACRDWQRLYRLPHATRDALTGPEKHETIGDTFAIGRWPADAFDAQDVEGACDVVPLRRRRADDRVYHFDSDGDLRPAPSTSTQAAPLPPVALAARRRALVAALATNGRAMLAHLDATDLYDAAERLVDLTSPRSVCGVALEGVVFFVGQLLVIDPAVRLAPRVEGAAKVALTAALRASIAIGKARAIWRVATGRPAPRAR